MIESPCLQLLTDQGRGSIYEKKEAKAADASGFRVTQRLQVLAQVCAQL